MFLAVQPQPHMAGQDLAFLLGKLSVDFSRRAPGGGAMLLAVPSALPGGTVQQEPEHIGPGANKNGRGALLRPDNV